MTDQKFLYTLFLQRRPTQIEFFINDYNNATQSASNLDTKVQSDASAISSNYANLAALSLRQVLASTDITIKKSSDNEWDLTDVKIFMKNIGNVGGGGCAFKQFI